jgi:lycopene beta-cyclase
VAKHWDVAWFASEAFSRDLNLQPYRYQMIRGIDFYQQVLTLLQQHPKVTFVQEKVTDIEETEQQIFVKTTEAVYFGKRVLNSIYNPALVARQNEYPVLQQHFVGWC